MPPKKVTSTKNTHASIKETIKETKIKRKNSATPLSTDDSEIETMSPSQVDTTKLKLDIIDSITELEVQSLKYRPIVTNLEIKDNKKENIINFEIEPKYSTNIDYPKFSLG